MSVLSHNTVRMANLCVMGTHCVNGVSELHSDIIKESIFRDFYDYTPEKFKNVTNGIAHRRWLNQANPELCALLNDTIGEGYAKNAEKLAEFKKFEKDESVLKRLGEIKRIKKQQLAERVKKVQGIDIDPETLFDVQAKRLHEYKRQLLNVLHIISDYNALRENPNSISSLRRISSRQRRQRATIWQKRPSSSSASLRKRSESSPRSEKNSTSSSLKTIT